MTKIDDLLADHQSGHSEFQMDHFITSKAGGFTLYGRYKQALRELHKRHRGLTELGFSLEKLRIKVDKLEYEIGLAHGDKYEFSLRAVKLAQKKSQLEELDHSIADTKREYDHFLVQCLALKERLGDLSDGRREQLDAAMWIHNVKVMAAADYLLTKSLSRSTLEIIMVLPKDVRVALLEEVNQDPAKILAWLEDQEVPKLDFAPAKEIPAPV